MKSIYKSWLLGAVLAAASATAFAQMGGGPGMGAGQGAPRQGGMMCCGPDNTMGWGMMSRQERADHRSKMRAMKSYDECKTYMDEHHAQMMARAKEKGMAMPAQPRHDACAALKKKS